METSLFNPSPPMIFSLESFFTPSTLWVIFLLALGVFAILSAILLYHWREYAPRESVANKAVRIYFSVSGALVLLLLVSLLTLTF